MRSLRLKLIFTFLIISITGTLLTTVIVSLYNERALDELLREQEQADVTSELVAYYESTGSWLGVRRAVVEGDSPAQPLNTPDQQQPRIEQPPSRFPFGLADENGLIVIPNAQHPLNTAVPLDVLAMGAPLVVDGEQVGILLVDNTPPPRNPATEAFAAQTNQALLIGALGGTAVALILAIIMARTLTRPLRELAAASREMAQGNLQQEVPVRTKDELGELALAFNQMSADLTHANQARRQMTADIAHDLRTPLTVLSGYLEAMEDGVLAPTTARLQMMHQEVDVLKRLVADLRTLSLADAGQLVLEKEPVNVADLLVQVQTAYGHQAEQQGVMIVVKTEYLTPVHATIALDKARMRQVLDNLVSNALRYTPANGTITLVARSKESSLQILVSDTGTGIPKADLPHIFNRFYRGDTSRQEGSGESGLGLAIVKSLVEAMDGSIVAESASSNMGTMFIITFPMG